MRIREDGNAWGGNVEGRAEAAVGPGLLVWLYGSHFKCWRVEPSLKPDDGCELG